jgi:hypothetical protein
MAKRVYVTGAQKDAAQMLVERGAANGTPASDAVKKIANAKLAPAPDRSAATDIKGTSGGRDLRKSDQGGMLRRATGRPAPDAT